MTTHRLTSAQFAARFRANEDARRQAAHSAMFEAAALGAEVLAQAAPVDQGTLKASIRVATDSAGAPVILIEAPHAGHVERGIRPGHAPPLRALAGWVKRHARDFRTTGRRRAVPRVVTARARARKPPPAATPRMSKAAVLARELAVTPAQLAIARAIQFKIRRDGIAPTWFVRKNLPKLGKLAGMVVKARMGKSAVVTTDG